MGTGKDLSSPEDWPAGGRKRTPPQDRSLDGTQGEGTTMHSEARSKRLEAVSTHPLAELLACPPSTSSLLTASAQSIGFQPGDVIFDQSAPYLGLYLVISGQLLRRAE